MLFADDANFLNIGKSIHDLHIQSEIILTKLSEWFISNKLSLNVFKTNYCTFQMTKTKLSDEYDHMKIENDNIYRVSAVKYLGE